MWRAVLPRLCRGSTPFCRGSTPPSLFQRSTFCGTWNAARKKVSVRAAQRATAAVANGCRARRAAGTGRRGRGRGGGRTRGQGTGPRTGRASAVGCSRTTHAHTRTHTHTHGRRRRKKRKAPSRAVRAAAPALAAMPRLRARARSRAGLRRSVLGDLGAFFFPAFCAFFPVPFFWAGPTQSAHGRPHTGAGRGAAGSGRRS